MAACETFPTPSGDIGLDRLPRDSQTCFPNIPLLPDDLPDERVSHASEELTSIMSGSVISTLLNATSSPASPTPSSPPLDPAKPDDFIPPTRPSSTPFPNSEPLESARQLAFFDSDFDSLDYIGDECRIPGQHSYGRPERPASTPKPRLGLANLPLELVDSIFDHIFGPRVATVSSSSVRMAGATKSWNTALRHYRRRELSDLALVNRNWRVLVQSRIFRHLKIKASHESLSAASNFLSGHTELRSYVRHFEVWFPVFQPQFGPMNTTGTPVLPTVTPEGLTSATYILPVNKCSLEEIFRFVAWELPEVCVITLEGGERKKAPKVHNRQPGSELWPVVVPSVRTLITKGQWNLIRDERDFTFIMSSLPNLNEWHGSYSKPKSKSYLNMATVLPSLPANLTRLNLCLEGDYRRETACPRHYVKVSKNLHFCTRLAEASPALEHLAYTGRVCKAFFDVAALRTNPRMTRLQSIDFTLKNICRPISELHDSGSGIQDMRFIQCFESLVVSAIRSMRVLTALKYLRIRYIDLESIIPPLNPYFIFDDNQCSGVWSDQILDDLRIARPQAQFEELNDSFGELGFKEGRLFIVNRDMPRLRVVSLRLASYLMLQQPNGGN